MPIYYQGGPLRDESQIAFIEKHNYLKREADYALSLCSSFRGDHENEHFSKNLRAAADSVLAYLKEAWRIEGDRKTVSSLKDRLSYKNSIDRIFENLPGILSAMTISYLQRKQKGIHQFFSRGTRVVRFALSETHLDYPCTFRGIEGLVRWLHKTLSPFWGEIKCSPSLLSISTERSAAFVGALEKGVFLADNINEIADHFKHILNSTYISIPRWHPAQLRYLALLAHEMFHKVLFLCDMFEEVCLEAKIAIDEADKNNNRIKINRIYDALAKAFGGPIIELFAVRSSLSELLVDFFKQIDIPSSPNKRQADSASREIIADSNIDEILADVGGLVLCGPAYLYSLPYELESDIGNLEDSFRFPDENYWPSHPPNHTRIKFLVNILAYLGFEKTAVQFDEYFGFNKIWEEVSNKINLIKDYYNFLTNNPTLNILKSYSLRLIDLIKSTAGCQPYTAISPYGIAESQWISRWQNLITKIVDKEIFAQDLKEFLPTDVINAIWAQVLKDNFRKMLPQKLGWRIALRNLA